MNPSPRRTINHLPILEEIVANTRVFSLTHSEGNINQEESALYDGRFQPGLRVLALRPDGRAERIIIWSRPDVVGRINLPCSVR
jgi:hypothetical protein